ncbi:hypothetical protein [Streptomyces sp. PSKA30]|uniref:hypothetical protein n=1 Tax=Streptomyces sp. PSKA30 TaxID=2874597 RepID=UPI001CD07000|nr:hypothetical protein [Streptomyces sp. PSKA30]
MVFRTCGHEWEMAEEALPLLQHLMSATPSAVPLGELAAAAGISVADVAAIVSELMDGQAVTVEGSER